MLIIFNPIFPKHYYFNIIMKFALEIFNWYLKEKQVFSYFIKDTLFPSSFIQRMSVLSVNPQWETSIDFIQYISISRLCENLET